MKKKLFMLILSVMLSFVIVGCKSTTTVLDTKEATCPEPTVCPVCEEPQDRDLTPSPVVTPGIYHWVPEAINALVTANIDLKGATESTIKVLLNGLVLENFVDYEVADGTLTIFGQTLSDLELVVGSYPVTVLTSQGSTEFTIEVVKDASLATSVPTKTIKGINMKNVTSYVPTEVIANAPDLMITEVGVDMYEYSYIEVYNNTNASYNLKNHRIVFADLTKQLMLDQEIFDQPLGMASAAYIYQDYEIPAFTSAIIWLVASHPWSQGDGTLQSGATGKVMIEDADVQNHIFGSNPENLSITKFRNVYGLAENVLVFPVRPQAALMNGTSSGDDFGYGASPIKAASSRFVSFNSKIANRGVQFQKFDLSKTFPITTVEGATYYKYEVGVINQEENVYVNGALDKSKIEVYGGRETINAFFARKVYYNASNEVVGYASKTSAIDTYNAPKAGNTYLQMYTDIVTPSSTALIYGTYEDVDGTITLSNWGGFRSLEYTLPVAGSTLMRYIPLSGTRTVYETQLASETTAQLKLSGLAPEVAEINANSDLIVPESNAYSTDYLSSGYNTIGRGISANFGLTN